MSRSTSPPPARIGATVPLLVVRRSDVTREMTGCDLGRARPQRTRGSPMGVKLFAFSRRREGTTPDEFHEYWRDVHARQIADEPTLRRHVRRYELNHRLPQDYARDHYRPEATGAGWDGAAVLWFDSMADFEALRAEPAYSAHVDDGQKFREASQLSVFTRDPDVIVDKPGRAGAGAKMVCILHRNPALDLTTFHDHWLHHH